MTSLVVFTFFIICFASSVADDPTGLKVRMCRRAQPVLNKLAVTVLEELVNKPLGMFKFTHLQVQRSNVDFKNSSLVFDFKDIIFTAEVTIPYLSYVIGPHTVTSKELAIMVQVGLNKNCNGKLNVDILACKCNNNFYIEGSGDILKRVVLYFKKNAFCSLSKRFLLLKINSMLENFTMTANLHKQNNINVDYGLSNNIQINPDCFTVSFKGAVFMEKPYDLSSMTSTDIVFSETDRMAYVGISELPFNTAGQAIFDVGIFQIDPSKMPDGLLKSLINGLVPKLKIKEGQLAVALDSAPTFSITRQGVSTTLEIRVHSLVEPVEENEVYHMTCKLENLQVIVQENDLLAKYKEPDCKLNTKSFGMTLLVEGGSKILASVYDGYKIPLPEGINFINGKTEYNDGYIVFAGDLSSNSTSRLGSIVLTQDLKSNAPNHALNSVWVLLFLGAACILLGLYGKCLKDARK